MSKLKCSSLQVRTMGISYPLIYLAHWIPSNVDAGILVTPNEKQHVVHYHTPAPFWFVLSRVQLPTLNSKDDQIWDSKDIRCFRKQAACLLSFHSKASILPDIVQRCYHTQNWIGNSILNLKKQVCLRDSTFSWAFLVIREEISKFQLSVLKELLGHFEEELWGTAWFFASLLLFDLSLAGWTDGLSLLKASQEACFFSRSKICFCTISQTSILAPGLSRPDARGAALPIFRHLLGPRPLLGLAVSLVLDGCLTSLQCLPSLRLTALCVLQVRSTGSFNLWHQPIYPFFFLAEPPITSTLACSAIPQDPA